jgi:hypothetical protein
MQNANVRLFTSVLLFSFLLLIAGYEAYGQVSVLKGTIIDSLSLEPVSFATVYIDYKTGTIADEQGFFTIQLPADKLSDTLNISCVGFTGKRLPVKDLKLLLNNGIYLQRNIYEISSIIVKAKAKKVQKPEKIVSRAISLIPDNYSGKRVVYKGYYREYLKDRNTFLNLFESILNLEDYGIALNYNFNANLEFKRLNKDFRLDSSLFKPYDNEDKYVPMARVHLSGKNELAVLKSTDPIKNKFGYSISYIDNLRKDYLLNHSFNSVKITYLNDRPYYVISFKDINNYTIGVERITMNGTIYIDAENYGIKKINYLATLHSSIKTKKLYELNVEYQQEGDKYYLHYISYNNLFKTSSFACTGAVLRNDTLELAFNRKLKMQKFTAENIKVFYNKNEQSIEQISNKENLLQLTFSDTSAISREIRKSTDTFLNLKKNSNADEILSALRLEFNGIRDIADIQLSNQPFSEYYQYREFFVHEIYTENPAVLSNPLNVTIPVFESEPVDGGSDRNISWFNTPLIQESTEKIFP